jgi:hypothetical protein
VARPLHLELDGILVTPQPFEDPATDKNDADKKQPDQPIFVEKH